MSSEAVSPRPSNNKVDLGLVVGVGSAFAFDYSSDLGLTANFSSPAWSNVGVSTPTLQRLVHSCRERDRAEKAIATGQLSQAERVA